MTNIRRCEKCGRFYCMGRTGMVDGCDACLHVERDKDNRAWLPDELDQIYSDVDNEGNLIGEPWTVTRAEAFSEATP